MATPREIQVAHFELCGPDCTGLGWPHEWDPIETGDTCLLGGGHKVQAPYVRVGSGYACEACA